MVTYGPEKIIVITDDAQFLEDLECNPFKKYTAQELKKQYHKLAKKHHPDNGGKDDNFKKISHAYNMLTNPEYKYKHISNEVPINLNAILTITIGFNEAFFGGNFTITTNPIFINENREPIVVDKEKDIFLDVEVINIKIRPGFLDGSQICIKEKGLCYKEKRGDLLINVSVSKHPRFKLSHSDVLSVEKIPLDLIIKGGLYYVNTMYGIKELQIPPGTKPNTELKIPNAGVQRIGSHIVLVQLMYPTSNELKNNPSWKNFGIKWPKERT
jgi:DnaJ-class molecular chaperone